MTTHPDFSGIAAACEWALAVDLCRLDRLKVAELWEEIADRMETLAERAREREAQDYAHTLFAVEEGR